MRFGLIDGKEYSYREIGRKFNVTHGYIHEVAQKALNKIRKKVNQIEYDEEILSEIDKENFSYQALCQIKPTEKEKKKQKASKK